MGGTRANPKETETPTSGSKEDEEGKTREARVNTHHW